MLIDLRLPFLLPIVRVFVCSIESRGFPRRFLIRSFSLAYFRAKFVRAGLRPFFATRLKANTELQSRNAFSRTFLRPLTPPHYFFSDTRAPRISGAASPACTSRPLVRQGDAPTRRASSVLLLPSANVIYFSLSNLAHTYLAASCAT